MASESEYEPVLLSSLSSPGGWLAAYRRRTGGPGVVVSPEALSKLLGVSGMTVRRWESNLARPNESDLRRLAEVCDLAPIEQEFLLRAFRSQESEPPPQERDFSAIVRRVLQSEFPAVVYDSFFYGRARNSYMAELFPATAGWHAAGNVFVDILDELARKPSPESETRVQMWFRRLWFSTSHLCGAKSYRMLLHELSNIAGFHEHWCELASRPPANALPQAHLTITFVKTSECSVSLFRSWFCRRLTT